MTPERLSAMRQAGFRVLGFGVESFALEILREIGRTILQWVVNHLESDDLSQASALAINVEKSCSDHRSGWMMTRSQPNRSDTFSHSS